MCIKIRSECNQLGEWNNNKKKKSGGGTEEGICAQWKNHQQETKEGNEAGIGEGSDIIIKWWLRREKSEKFVLLEICELQRGGIESSRNNIISSVSCSFFVNFSTNTPFQYQSTNYNVSRYRVKCPCVEAAYQYHPTVSTVQG